MLKAFDVQIVVEDWSRRRCKTKCLRGFNFGLRGGAVEAAKVCGSVCSGLHRVYMGLRSGRVGEWRRFVPLFLCLVFNK